MVTLLSEQFRYPFVRFGHKVVDHHQVTRLRVERRPLR